MLLNAMIQFLRVEQLRDPAQVRFDREALVPSATLAEFDVTRRSILLAKALVGQRNRLAVIPGCQLSKGVITLIGRQPSPIDDLARIVDQPGQFDADKRASVRFAFLANLLLAAAIDPRMDQLNAVAVDHREERRLGQKIERILGIIT